MKRSLAQNLPATKSPAMDIFDYDNILLLPRQCRVKIDLENWGVDANNGATVEVDGKRYKVHYGSASDFNKGEYKPVEGKRILEPIKGTLDDTLREMREDLQSSISYADGRVLADLKKVNYVVLGGENAGEHLLM